MCFLILIYILHFTDEKRLPWAGAGVGIVLGVIIVIADQLFTKAPSISVSLGNCGRMYPVQSQTLVIFQHPSLMVLLVMVVSGIGYGVACSVRYYARLQKRSLLQPPIDMLADFKKDDPKDTAADEELITNRNRYSKAQARQRFRKGKS